MSTLVTIVLLLLLLLLVTPAEAMSAAAVVGGEGRGRPPSVPFRARLHRRQPLFHGRAANGCMPRGFRVPPSAPSRYVNYHTLDAGVCDHGDGRKP